VVPVSESDDRSEALTELAELHEHARALEDEVLTLRRRLQDAPKRVRTLEERLLETKGQLSQAVSQNEKLTYTLREARDHIAALREEVDKLTQPPSAYGTLLGHNDDGTVDVFTCRRKRGVVLGHGLGLDHRLRETEIQDLGRAVRRHHDVAGLQVAMDDAFLVGGVERRRNLKRQPQRLRT
jgi:proteasome-associated ATPase